MEQKTGRCKRKDLDQLIALFEMMRLPDPITIKVSRDVMDAAVELGICSFSDGLLEPGRSGAALEDGQVVSGYKVDEDGNCVLFRYTVDKASEVAQDAAEGRRSRMGRVRALEARQQELDDVMPQLLADHENPNAAATYLIEHTPVDEDRRVWGYYMDHADRRTHSKAIHALAARIRSRWPSNATEEK